MNLFITKIKKENNQKRRIEYTEQELSDYFQIHDSTELKELEDVITKIQVEFWSDVYRRLVKVKLILKK